MVELTTKNAAYAINARLKHKGIPYIFQVHAYSGMKIEIWVWGVDKEARVTVSNKICELIEYLQGVVIQEVEIKYQ